MPTISRVRWTLVVLSTCFALGSAAAAQAGFDHLQCFRIKDAMDKTIYSADVTSSNPIFAAALPDCIIRTPAKLLCVDAEKTNVDPPPPGAPPGITGQAYLCYRAKCFPTRPSTALTDQFGTHLISIKSATLVCAPVPSGDATTTTTTPACNDFDDDTWTDCAGDCDESIPEINPGATEICDGLDNNCDGRIDESDPSAGSACDTGSPGECQLGLLTCNSPELECVQETQPTPEQCDGLDNDCNGAIDEGNPGGGVPCMTAIPGICSTGTQNCQGGALQCIPDVDPGSQAEICDGLDNDCNGAVDEGDPGGGGPCATGFPGMCSSGTQSCVTGSLECVPFVTPGSQAEICDGIDNNCDGSIDEGNPEGGAPCMQPFPGICSTGTRICLGGSVSCDAIVPGSQAEICNGLDDDCDGEVDEGGVCG